MLTCNTKNITMEKVQKGEKMVKWFELVPNMVRDKLPLIRVG